MNIVNQNDWDSSYNNYKFHEENDILAKTIDKYIEKHNKKFKNIFEVGCFPCRYLSHFAKKFNLEANGVDLTNQMDERLFNWLKEKNVTVGNIINDDAFKTIDKLNKQKKQFDIVYSIGFIEHFTNYLEIIDYHDKILKKGGLLIISTPNFRGKIQNLYHRVLDEKNLKKHVLESMNIDEWKNHISDRYEILECEYTGGIKFWMGSEVDSEIKRFIGRAISVPFLIVNKPNSKSFSPYCLIVARKK